MKRLFLIYKSCIKYAFAGAVAYRLNFVLTLLSALCFYAAFPLVTLLVYGAGASFPGWGFYEVLLIQSIFILSAGFTDLIVNGILWSTMGHIREGTYEVVLLKPLPPLLYLMFTSFNPECVSMVIGGGVLFGVALANTGVAGFAAVIQFIALLIAGVAVMTGGLLIVAASSFKWVGNSRMIENYDSIMTFGKYPVTIFPTAVKATITFIIPVGMVGFYPASALLGQAIPAAFIAVVPCILFMLFGFWLYRQMIRLYEGVGG